MLLPCELNWLVAQPHKPLAVGQALSVILQAVDLDAQTKTSVDKTLSTYVYEFGGCNRIYNTAIPSAYTRWVCSKCSGQNWLHSCGRCSPTTCTPQDAAAAVGVAAGKRQ